MIYLGDGFYYALISKEYDVKAVYDSNNKRFRIIKKDAIIEICTNVSKRTFKARVKAMKMKAPAT